MASAAAGSTTTRTSGRRGGAAPPAVEDGGLAHGGPAASTEGLLSGTHHVLLMFLDKNTRLHALEPPPEASGLLRGDTLTSTMVPPTTVERNRLRVDRPSVNYNVNVDRLSAFVLPKTRFTTFESHDGYDNATGAFNRIGFDAAYAEERRLLCLQQPTPADVPIVKAAIEKSKSASQSSLFTAHEKVLILAEWAANEDVIYVCSVVDEFGQCLN